MNGRMVDRYGRCVEVILLDRGDGHGAQPWLRVSYRRVLLGPGTRPGPGAGYYRTPDAALAQVDAESLVELVHLPTGAGVTPPRGGPRTRVRAPVRDHKPRSRSSWPP